MTAMEISQSLKLHALKTQSWQIQACSAKDGTGSSALHIVAAAACLPTVHARRIREAQQMVISMPPPTSIAQLAVVYSGARNHGGESF